ncbi:MAG: ATPase, T2SS/T4P/T4SS family, partial [Gemmatimonadota bacterium]
EAEAEPDVEAEAEPDVEAAPEPYTEPYVEPGTDPDAGPDPAPTPAAQTAPEPAAEGEAQAVARLASLILLDAIRQGATRIIIESSGGGNGIVRFRVDGIERRYMNLSVVAMNRVIERLAALAGAVPGAGGRTGAARVKAGEHTYAFHLVVGQMGGAQRAFVRIQDTAWHPRLDELGIAERELAALQKLVAARTGLLLIAGPEGSGRSTVARALLRAFVAGGRRPAAVEERAGSEVEGVAHTRPGPGGAMAAAVLAVSRGRDVLLVDEVHDAPALAAVVEAAHDRLVLAVVDAPDAPAALRGAAERLGQPAAIAAVARGAVAFRQLRSLCDACSQPAGDLDESEAGRAEAFGTRPSRRAVGCPRCGQTGYRGSVQVAAVLPVDERVRGLLGKLAGADELQRAARTAGYRPLLQVALARVAAGDTTLAEVERVVAAPPVPAGQPALAPLVLVVDDDAETRVLARSALESAGYRVEEAANGELALQRLVTGEDCALVVLDLLMPGMDGHEVLHRIKSDILTAGVHVVVLTGSDNPEDERRAMTGGAEDYVRKPLDPTQFLARVAAALHRRAAAELVG